MVLFILFVIGFLWITFWWAKVTGKAEERTYNENVIIKKNYSRGSLVVFKLKYLYHTMDEVINLCSNTLKTIGVPFEVVSVSYSSVYIVITIKVL